MAESLVEIRFKVPRGWRDELHAAAEAQAISLSDLLRLVVRAFLRQRYTAGEQEVLAR